MSRVVLDSVDKTFIDRRRGTAHAVRGLSLDIQPGECLVLLGPSGCGKSTVLRLIAGLEKPDTGTIRIDGRDMARVPPQDRDVAMVFQSFALYPHLSVAGNLTLGLKLRKIPDIEPRLRETAELLGLGGLLQRLPKELSGGERQRVAIGRAIIRRPKVLLFDEPLSQLDAPLRVQLRAEIAALHRRTGATLVHVTHDQAEAMALAGRIAVMKDGQVLQCADPATIHRRPATAFVAGFVGSPPMNLVRGTLRRAGGEVAFLPAGSESGRAWRVTAASDARVAACDGELLFGLRPEHFHLAGGDADLQGIVMSVESLGSENLLRVRVGGSPIVVRLLPGPVPGMDEAVNLRVDWDAASLFHAENGRALLTEG